MEVVVEVEEKQKNKRGSRRNPLISFVTVSERETATSKRKSARKCSEALLDAPLLLRAANTLPEFSVCNNLNSKSSLTPEEREENKAFVSTSAAKKLAAVAVGFSKSIDPALLRTESHTFFIYAKESRHGVFSALVPGKDTSERRQRGSRRRHSICGQKPPSSRRRREKGKMIWKK